MAKTKKKLDKLTQAQIDAMPKYVEKWVAIGLSTERVNFEKVKPFVIPPCLQFVLDILLYTFAIPPSLQFVLDILLVS